MYIQFLRYSAVHPTITTPAPCHAPSYSRKPRPHHHDAYNSPEPSSSLSLTERRSSGPIPARRNDDGGATIGCGFRFRTVRYEFEFEFKFKFRFGFWVGCRRRIVHTSHTQHAHASAWLGSGSEQNVREIHTHALHVALARDRLDHLPRDREGLSHIVAVAVVIVVAPCYRSRYRLCSSLCIDGVLLGICVQVGCGAGRRREAADEKAALVEGERGVLDAEVARARDVREGAPDDDVRRRAPVRVRAGLDGPERSPHRVYIIFTFRSPAWA